MKIKKIRLDELLTATYKIEKKIAQSYILQGMVFVNDQKITKSHYKVSIHDKIHVKQKPYPSRSAYKLLEAIQKLNLNHYIHHRICMDIGASHGGFTKVLLEYSAKKIYAIDVARGIIDFSLRIHPSVILLEQKNIKNIQIQDFDIYDFSFTPWFITCDVSFLSLITVLKTLKNFQKEIKKQTQTKFSFYGIFLLKPQFENSQKTIKGIIKDDNIRKQIIHNTIEHIHLLDYKTITHFPCSLKGTKGNQEEIIFLYSQ